MKLSKLGSILFLALGGFQVFNFSTTDYALKDVLGEQLAFGGVPWHMILSIAFCLIDLTVIATAFAPKEDIPEGWYVWGGWIMAVCMNLTLTWWAASLAMSARDIGSESFQMWMPVGFIGLVFLIRVILATLFHLFSNRIFLFPPSDQE